MLIGLFDDYELDEDINNVLIQLGFTTTSKICENQFLRV